MSVVSSIIGIAGKVRRPIGNMSPARLVLDLALGITLLAAMACAGLAAPAVAISAALLTPMPPAVFSPTEEPTSTATFTASATDSPTFTLTPTDTATPTSTSTSTATATSTETLSPTATLTSSPTTSPTPLPRPASTSTPAPAPAPPGSGWRAPILMYHYIRVNPDPNDRLGFNLSVPPDEFDRQMRYLAENGYQTVSFDQIYDPGQPLPKKPVLLTFDDGYADAYTAAFPILQRYGFKATFYIVTSFINKPRYLTTDQIQQMAAAGMSFGSHSISHSILTDLSAARVESEVRQSRVELERLLGRPVLDFCYPSGRVNAAVQAAVSRAGYRSATTVSYGVASSTGDQLLLPRFRVYGGLNLAGFANLVRAGQ